MSLVHKSQEPINVQLKTQVEAKKVFPPFDQTTYPSQILWLSIGFCFFYFFLKKIILPRISYTLEMRRDRLEQDMQSALRAKEETDLLIDSYNTKLKEAKIKGHMQAEESRKKAKMEAEFQQKKLIENLKKNFLESKTKIDEKKEKAKNEIALFAEEISNLIIKRVQNKKNEKDSVIDAIKLVRK